MTNSQTAQYQKEMVRARGAGCKSLEDKQVAPAKEGRQKNSVVTGILT